MKNNDLVGSLQWLAAAINEGMVVTTDMARCAVPVLLEAAAKIEQNHHNEEVNIER